MESDNDSEFYNSEDQLESDLDEPKETAKNRQTNGKKRKHVEQHEKDEDLDDEEGDEDSNDNEDVEDLDDDTQDSDEEDVGDEVDSDIADDKMSKRTKFGDDPRFQFASDKLNKTGEDSDHDEGDGRKKGQREQSKSGKAKESKKESKPGIIYLSRIPPLMKPKKLNIIFSQYGEVGRMFFQQEDKNFRKQRKKKGGNRANAYTEGWIEFKKKKIAKRVALTFNNTRVGVKKRSRYYDDLWNIKYLHRFQWAHLMERLEYEKQVRSQRVRTEIMQAKKETNFYLKNVEQQKVLERMQTNKKNKGKNLEFKGRNFKQWRTEEERAEDRRMLHEAMPQRSGKVTSSVLGKIFKK